MTIRGSFNISQVINWKYLFALAVILSFLLIIGGYVYFKTESKRIRTEKYNYLKTITNYKIAQIESWREERMADALHFSLSPLYVKAIESWFETRDNKMQQEIVNRNRLISKLRGFKSVFVGTKDSIGFFSSDSIKSQYNDVLLGYIKSAISDKKVIFTDFYYDHVAKCILLAIVAPMVNMKGESNYALVFLVNPSYYLYPLIQATLMPALTSEIVIVRKSGDSVLYINELKHKPGLALKLSKTLKETQLPSVQAVLGKEGMVEGKDYRDIEVLSYIRHIKNTNWYIVSKVDKAEIFSELKYKAGVTFILVCTLILFSISAILVLAVFQRRKQDKALINEIQHTLNQLNQAELISKTGNWELHLKNHIIYGSLGAQRIYGVQSSIFPLNEIQDIVLPQYRDKLDTALVALIKNNVPYDIEFKIKQVGTDNIIDIHSVATYDSKSRIIFGTIQDISEFKKQEELLREKDLVFQSLLEFSPIFVFFKDHNIRAIHLSKNYEKMLGMPVSEILGKDMFELFPSELAKSMIEDDKQVIFNGNLVEVEEELNGRSFTTIKFPIKREGYPPMLAGFTIDITDRKKAESELKIALERAEKSDKLKEAFLQNMSHEIRTPLNAIVGFSELLNDPLISNDKKQSYTSIILNSSNQLLSIVNDILTIARIQTNQEILNLTKVSVNKMMNSLHYIFVARAHEKNIELIPDLTLPDQEAEIITDNTKLNQILANLISNAIKFTHQGFVKFGYNRKEENLEFYVRDTGIGIKKEHFESIFERFSQADISISKKYGGTGLGLSICKAYTNLLGGKIWVESEPDNGSVFYFIIPYKVVDYEDIKPAKTSEFALADKIILVVEDEAFNYELIKEILSESKFTLIHARNGLEAVDICKHNPHINMVLMDIKMPEMDGQTAAKIIKEFSPTLPIIAQTAYALTYQKEEFMKSGFNDYITKPIDKNELISILNKY